MAEMTDSQKAFAEVILEGVSQKLLPLTERIAKMEQDLPTLRTSLDSALASDHKPGLCNDATCQMCRDSRTVIVRQAQELTRAQLSREIYEAASEWGLGPAYDQILDAVEKKRKGVVPAAQDLVRITE